MLNFEITSTKITLTPVIENVFFQLTSTELECHVRSYYGNVPIFAVVLDFMEIFGGIY
jgi:hypothetical protein